MEVSFAVSKGEGTLLNYGTVNVANLNAALPALVFSAAIGGRISDENAHLRPEYTIVIGAPDGTGE